MRLAFFLLSLTISLTSWSQISDGMKRFIKKTEGLSLSVYMDGYYRAVGYGHRICQTDNEWVRELELFDEITEEAAETLFSLDMYRLVGPGLLAVMEEIGTDYPQNVYDVMGSLIYNMGLEGLKETEFYRLFKKREYRKSFEKLLVTKIGKPGLMERRVHEVQMLMTNFDWSSGHYVVSDRQS